MRSGSDPLSALSVDRMTTAAVSPLSGDSEIISDELLIRDLIAGLGEADLARPHPWSNPETGSAGVISTVTDAPDGARACRTFRTTRHGFDGVALFSGRACRRPDGGWDLLALDRIGA